MLQLLIFQQIVTNFKIFKYLIEGDQKGLFKLAIQLRAFCYAAVSNTATG
jgi:hypothetical protein